MNNKKITVAIGEAIREGKYLSITYKNKEEKVNHFWISIIDIAGNDKIVVDMFNVMKDEPLFKKTISMSFSVILVAGFEISSRLRHSATLVQRLKNSLALSSVKPFTRLKSGAVLSIVVNRYAPSQARIT